MYKEIGFSECDITDGFFDSLKEDCPGFESWFSGRSESGATVFVSKDDEGRIEAFVHVKDGECESVGEPLPSRSGTTSSRATRLAIWNTISASIGF